MLVLEGNGTSRMNDLVSISLVVRLLGARTNGCTLLNLPLRDIRER